MMRVSTLICSLLMMVLLAGCASIPMSEKLSIPCGGERMQTTLSMPGAGLLPTFNATEQGDKSVIRSEETTESSTKLGVATDKEPLSKNELYLAAGLSIIAVVGVFWLVQKR